MSDALHDAQMMLDRLHYADSFAALYTPQEIVATIVRLIEAMTDTAASHDEIVADYESWIADLREDLQTAQNERAVAEQSCKEARAYADDTFAKLCDARDRLAALEAHDAL